MMSVFPLIRSVILRSATIPAFAAARLMEEVSLTRAHTFAAARLLEEEEEFAD